MLYRFFCVHLSNVFSDLVTERRNKQKKKQKEKRRGKKKETKKTISIIPGLKENHYR